MDNVTTIKDTCTQYMNYSCWVRYAAAENQVYSDQMAPVAIMMILFQIIGIPGNIVVLLMYASKSRKSTANIFIMLLASVDLFACVVIHPYVVYKLYNYYDQTWTVACKIFEFLIHLNLVMSGLSLLLVAIDRYFAICKPVKFLQFDRHVYKGIISITAISVAVSVPLLEFYGPNPYTYEFEECFFVGYRCDYQPKYQGSVFYTAFSVFVMAGFITEIIAMSILYKNVAVVAYKSRHAVFPLSNAHIFAGLEPFQSGSESNPSSSSIKTQTISKTSNCLDNSPNRVPLAFAPIYTEMRTLRQSQKTTELFNVESKSKLVSLSEKDKSMNHKQQSSKALPVDQTNNFQTNSNRFRDRLKAAKMLFFVTFVFFLSWMPFFILRVCYTLNVQACRMESYSGQVIDNMANHVFYINNAINPILYTVINKTFRVEFSQMVKRKCR